MTVNKHAIMDFLAEALLIWVGIVFVATFATYTLRELRSRRIGSDSSNSSDTGVPVNKTPEGKLWLTIASGKCPDCGSTEGFLKGPSGGISTNIECAHCASRFNVTPMIGIAERIWISDN